jgi:hypothetical protein
VILCFEYSSREAIGPRPRTLLIRLGPTPPLTPAWPGPGNESYEGACQGLPFAATQQEQPPTPTVIISESSPPNLRPEIILKIRQATERREKAKMETDIEGDMDINQ